MLSERFDQWHRPHARRGGHASSVWEQLPLFLDPGQRPRPAFLTAQAGKWALVLALLLAVATASSIGDRGTLSTLGPQERDQEAEVLAPEDAIPAHIEAASARHRVPEALIRAVISVESQFNPDAVSRKGAKGLMQLMPQTAALVGVRDPHDPRENIEGGASHLRAMLDRFDNDLPLALAAYNAGEQPVIAYRGVPPYPETRRFVVRVLRKLGDHKTADRLVARSAPPPRWVSPTPRQRVQATVVSHAADKIRSAAVAPVVRADTELKAYPAPRQERETREGHRSEDMPARRAALLLTQETGESVAQSP